MLELRGVNRGRALWILLAAVYGCHTPGEACLRVRSDVSMNLYEGKPHATDLYLYPLSDSLEFSQISPDELLAGAKPAGMTQSDAVKVTIFPGQSDLEIERQFAEATEELGVLADFYRERGDAEGTRAVVLRARCGRRTPRLYMSVSDLRVE